MKMKYFGFLIMLLIAFVLISGGVTGGSVAEGVYLPLPGVSEYVYKADFATKGLSKLSAINKNVEINFGKDNYLLDGGTVKGTGIGVYVRPDSELPKNTNNFSQAYGGIQKYWIIKPLSKLYTIRPVDDLSDFNNVSGTGGHTDYSMISPAAITLKYDIYFSDAYDNVAVLYRKDDGSAWEILPAVVNAGAAPVLVDVTKDFNIDVDKIEEALSERTKAIIPVHLSGYMADMPRIMEIAEKYDLVVIEDACQSLGSSIDGKMAGSWGLTSCWSFYPFKILGGYGDGGAITTDDPDVALFATRMRYNGEDRETGEYHGHGFTCLLDNLQAAFLDVKLRHLPAWIVRRKQIAGRYRQALSGIPGLLLPHYDKPGFDHVYQNYTVRSRQGDDFSEYLKKNGVEVLTQFRKPYYKHEALKLADRGFPETEALSREVCSLPMNVEISDEEIEYVIKAVRTFYGL